MSKLHDLAKKLQALAVGGVGGERDNAARMLADLCRKHGINLDSLFQPAPSKRLIPVESQEHLEFVFQCLASTSAEKVPAYNNQGKAGWFMEVTLSDAQYIELEAKATFYWPIWKQERTLFYNAFIQKHGLGREVEGAGSYTPAQIEEIRRKMKAMDGHTLHKQVGQ